MQRDMTTLTLELPPQIYQQLRERAERLGKSPQAIVREWLIERLSSPNSEPVSDREKVRAALRTAGLRIEMSPALRARVNPSLSLEEVETALAKAGGTPLSEIILEQRGPKG